MKAVVSRYVNGHLSDREPRTEPGTELGFSQQIKTFTKQKNEERAKMFQNIAKQATKHIRVAQAEWRQHSNKQHHNSAGDRKVINSKQATIVARKMFRFLSRQAFKVVPRPASRQIHSMRLPYTGPLSYDTIARRLSLDVVDPQGYLTRKRQQEAKNRGEFVDIHDIGRDPNDYDFLITDIKHETLETTIAEELGIPYLPKATESQAKEVFQVGDGYIHGSKFRAIVPFVVGHKGEGRWVFFMLDSGAPLTYLSAQVSANEQTFGIREGHPAPVTIGGHPKDVYMSPSNSHFPDVNLLGGDFCDTHGVYLGYDYVNSRVKLFFGGEWETVRKSKN
ncbi:hypothetical protein P167DRAFT_571885 [Morchella conica CCBAS932]|uniref:Uncharacterized protein n=1 Tax=Morchella conica CCBAS932 TaxID=1392247 RepID=A0A3N4KWV5_9PEZI|nr:hypothetical protein P167DRAFT_571885 [Morchella conica CCBAS932]